ncbi:MAG: alcohol dehydrogenase catalytic domain-containing protein [Planctomycetaceae bacterium]
MRAWRVVSDRGIEALEMSDVPEETLGTHDVRVRMRSASLNYRDLGVASGGYYRNNRRPVIALSDGAGEVVEVGNQVTRWRMGDRVCPIFVRDWLEGPPDDAVLETCLGGGIDGVLAEQRVLPESALVRIPSHLDYEEAATLPARDDGLACPVCQRKSATRTNRAGAGYGRCIDFCLATGQASAGQGDCHVGKRCQAGTGKATGGRRHH